MIVDRTQDGENAIGRHVGVIWGTGEARGGQLFEKYRFAPSAVGSDLI